MYNCWSVLAASLEHLPDRGNVASVSLFFRYYFGRCSSELDQLAPFPYSREKSSRYSDRLLGFSVTIHRCYNDVCFKSFFPLQQFVSSHSWTLEFFSHTMFSFHL